MSTAVLVRFRLGDIHPTKMSVNFLGWSFQDLVFEIPRKTPENEILWDVCLLKTHCACVRALLERATDDKVISSYSLLPFAAIHITNASVADQLLCVYAPSSVTTSCAQKLGNPVLYTHLSTSRPRTTLQWDYLTRRPVNLFLVTPFGFWSMYAFRRSRNE